MKETEKDIFRSLMANKDFKDWVRDPSSERNRYWEKWIEAHPEHKEAVNKARNSISKLTFKEEFLEESELDGILDNVISNKRSYRASEFVRPLSTKFNWWMAIAASIAILSVISYLFFNIMKNDLNSSSEAVVQLKKVFNPEGRRSKISLPDGSIVHLNAESTLIFPEVFNDSLRTVELYGEAYFEVEENKQKPFIVRSEMIETEVLGTSFNVRAFDQEDEINVALVTGKVRVKNENRKGDKSQVLVPGEKLTYVKSNSTYQKSQFDLIEETGWKNNILVFKNTDFKTFVIMIERWYGVEIKVEKAPDKKWSVNGHFENESLEEVLMGVKFTHEIDYDIYKNVVKLNCK